MYRQLTQLLAAARLISRPQGAGIRDLEDSIGVSRRTVYRIIEALEELGYPVYDESEGKEKRYKLNLELDRMRWWQPLPKAIFSFEDRVLIDFLFQKASANPILAKDIRALRKKIDILISDGGYSVSEKESGAGKSLPKKLVMIHDAPAGKLKSEVQYDFIRELLRSVEEKTACVVSYESMSSGNVKTYIIHPLALFEHNGGLYTFVFQPYYEKILILAVERIRTIELTENSFKIPDNFDAEKRLSDPFGIVLDSTPFIARVRFSQDQAPYILEREWPLGSKIENETEGTIILNIETAGTFELKRWIHSYGASAEVLEPDWLKDEIIEDLKATMKVYKS